MFRSTKKSKSSSPAAGGVIEPLTAHFVFALGFGRLVEFSFWMFNYHELKHTGMRSALPGYLVILSQAMQLLVMAEFFYYYLSAMKNNTPMVLPTSNSDVAG